MAMSANRGTAPVPTPSPQELERNARHVNPGGWAVDRDRALATLLGSCVSVCLFDPIAQIGGMNHFMLPTSSESSTPDLDSLLCGDYAMEALLNAMLMKGAKKVQIQAKAFGGGDILESLSGVRIGQRNVKFAREWLEREGIALVSSDFMGPWTRKLLFYPRNGDIFCKRIARSEALAPQVRLQEQAYQESLVKQKKKTDVELF